MKSRQITLIDLGLDRSFDASMTFIQATIQNINAGLGDAPVADISFVRSRDAETIQSTMLSSCDVLHVMAHGDKTYGPEFVSTDGETEFDLQVLAALVQGTGNGFRAHTILADACSTGTEKWQKALCGSLEQDITYIGTTRQITWHDSTVFGAAFYGAMFMRKGLGETSARHSFDAAERAATAYTAVTGTPCPFKVTTLTPNRKAKKLVVGPPRKPLKTAVTHTPK